MSATVCPQPERLAAYLIGNLPPAEVGVVSDHLETCYACRSRVESLEGSSDALLDRLRHISASGTQEPDTELARLIRRAKALAASSLSASAARDRAGTRIGDYELMRRLGAGTFGTVYLGRSVLLQRPVAIKVLNDAYRTHPQAKARFLREMQAVGRLPVHANVVQALHAAETDGTLFLVMEYLDGIDLSSRLRQHGPLRVADACATVQQAALGLQHVHAHGLVHRDVKPANLMLTAEGVIKVLDLGLARLAEELPPSAAGLGTSVGQFLGTPDYVAPEQADNPRSATDRSDVYSLGCSLYHLLAGRVPFPGDRLLAKLEAHRRQEPTPLAHFRADVPEALSTLVRQMMAKNPADRPTAREAATALEPFTAGADLPALAGIDSPVPPDLGSTATEAPRSRVPWLGIVTACVLLLALGIGLGIGLPRWRARRAPHTEERAAEEQPGPTRSLSGLHAPGRSLAFASDGALVAEGGNGLACWRRGQEDQPTVWEHGATSLAPSNVVLAANGRIYLALNEGPTTARVQGYDMAGNRNGGTLPCTASVLCLAVSPDGERLLVAESTGRVHIHDARTQALQHEFQVPEPFHRATVAAEGKRVLAGCADGLVRLYPLDGQEPRVFRGGTLEAGSSLLAVLLSADGTQVCAAGRKEQALRTWDAATGAVRAVIRTDTHAAMTCAVFMADGRRALTGHEDGSVMVWDLDQREATARHVRHRGPVASVAMAGDGRRAASLGREDGLVWLYRLPGPRSRPAQP